MNKKGFTLTELLIVFAIIGIFSLIIVASTGFSQSKARDQRRQEDLKEIQIGLAQYYQYYQQYPAGLTTGATTLSGFVLGGGGTIPTDPLTKASYYYAASTTSGVNTSYCIGALMETPVPSDNATACGTNGGLDNYMQQPPQ